MKKLLLCAVVITATFTGHTETVTINDKEYTVSTIIDRDMGPGVRYTRLRLPAYPLNVNMLRIDMTNPYNTVETTQANDRLFGTESLVAAAKRQSCEGHVALGGANANFWCVNGQAPYSDQLLGVTFNGNLRNGKIITETNCSADQWNRGTGHTGILGITADKRAVSGTNWTWKGTVTSSAGVANINTVNKTVRPGELGLYNSYHGATRAFRPVNQEGTNFVIAAGVSTEVYLTLTQGSTWQTNGDMTFTVKDIKSQAGDGCVGEYDAVLVGRDANAEYLGKLSVGDQVTINTSWISPDKQPVTFTNLVGGNAQVMAKSELMTQNDIETYNSQVYSRTGYGTNADGTMLYIIVIDKATDPVYGASAGCNTRAMCAIAATYGCTDMTNFDAGGSAEMYVNGAIVNTTTEGTPRAVANGMFAYSIAPADDAVSRLEFYDCSLQAPIYSSYTPRIIAYNKYGDIVTDNLTGFTLTCPVEGGTCAGSEYTAGRTPGETTLTATYNGVSVTKKMLIIDAQPEIRIKPEIVIDNVRSYPVEVTATVGENTYTFNPAGVEWHLNGDGVAAIDENGVLHGLCNGVAELGAVVGEFTDATKVSVEIPEGAKGAVFNGVQNPSDWSVTKTSLSTATVTALGNDGGISLDYAISSARAPKMTAARDCRIYSLPDAVEIQINPGQATIKQISLTLQTANETRTKIVTHDVALTADAVNVVRFDMSEYGNADDIATYPLTFKSLAVVSGDKAGTTAHIEIPAINAVYDRYANGIETITPDSIANSATYYNLQGQPVSGRTLSPGLYIRRTGNHAEKIIVK